MTIRTLQHLWHLIGVALAALAVVQFVQVAGGASSGTLLVGVIFASLALLVGVTSWMARIPPSPSSTDASTPR